jgi:hypothetical protein
MSTKNNSVCTGIESSAPKSNSTDTAPTLNSKPTGDRREFSVGGISLEQYRKTACISAFELGLGLPLDRIKIELQQGEKKIKPTRPYLKYWYAGNVPSLIQRCVIYMPAIKITNSYCDDKPGYIKPFIVAGVISPYVSLFEGLKTAQQKNVWQTAKSNNMVSIIRHIVYEINKPSRLVVSIVPTYLRECCFVGGMISLQPMLYSKLMEYNTFGFKIENTTTDVIPQNKVNLYAALSCLFASLISQTLSQPFDVIKTRIELQPTAKVADIFAKLRQNQLHYGWRSVYYAGWLPRVIRGMWTFTCMNYFINFI